MKKIKERAVTEAASDSAARIADTSFAYWEARPTLGRTGSDTTTRIVWAQQFSPADGAFLDAAAIARVRDKLSRFIGHQVMAARALSLGEVSAVLCSTVRAWLVGWLGIGMGGGGWVVRTFVGGHAGCFGGLAVVFPGLVLVWVRLVVLLREGG